LTGHGSSLNRGVGVPRVLHRLEAMRADCATWRPISCPKTASASVAVASVDGGLRGRCGHDRRLLVDTVCCTRHPTDSRLHPGRRRTQRTDELTDFDLECLGQLLTMPRKNS